MSEPIVTTTEGAVRGRADGPAHVFRAIPYAASPIGAARFAAPAPHRPWPGIRDATRPGATAPQARRDGFGALDMSPYFGRGWIRGEDYLTVDVWAPRHGSDHPVMVFVHGGGFVSGATRAPVSDGTAFARDDVILVSVGYRLGVTGFLDVPGAPANRGLLDIMAALGWVQRNIAAFGGDPDRVTLFGQSAGATLVTGVLAAPAAAGLVHRAIVQSGNGLGAFTPEQGERVTRAAAAALGIESTTAGFGAVPDEALVDLVPGLTGLDLRTATDTDPLVGLSPFGLVLEEQPAHTFATGAAAEVALMIGTNAEEGNLYLVPQGNLLTSTLDDVHALAARLHDDPRAWVDRYRSVRPEATVGQVRSAMLGDALFVEGSRRSADAHRAHARASTHTYEFGWRSPAVGGLLGAAHTVELPFVFDTVTLPELGGPRGMLGPTAAPAELANRMHAAWTRFARTGDPGWEPEQVYRFTAGDQQVQGLRATTP